MIKQQKYVRHEIGSEFWDIPISTKENNVFPEDTKWFLSGRTALRYIVQDSGIKSVAMPIWCCDSMIEPFTSSGVKVEFYAKLGHFDTDALFVLDYFGYANTSDKITDYKGIIIRDLTHSIFIKEYDDADYYFGSLRKWAGFYTGGFAWGKWKQKASIDSCDMEYVNMRKQAMHEKEKYMKGEIETKDYLKMYELANNLLHNKTICEGFKEDVFSARHFDVNFVKNKRRDNAQILLNSIHSIFELHDDDCPLFVPIETDERDSLRTYLIKNEIYCPVHWPHFDNNGKELSLICDQRYDKNDMNRICETIQKFFSEIESKKEI